jgi:hypothetical protein
MPTPRLLAVLALSAGALAGSATPAHAGPPWISIELPANPLDPTTRGAFLLVHTFHHDAVMSEALSGRAEGMVNGRRQTINLTFENTSRAGVRALRKSWPDGGTWVLVLKTGQHGDATALVGIGSDGTVRSINVPTETRGSHIVPTAVSAADVRRRRAGRRAQPGARIGRSPRLPGGSAGAPPPLITPRCPATPLPNRGWRGCFPRLTRPPVD